MDNYYELHKWIDKPTDYFNTKLYTGNGSTQSITGVGFQPDWIWLKDRDNAYSHQLVDVVRGNTKYLNSNETASEGTASDRVTSFDSDGFSLGSYIGTNKSSSNVVSWNWLAGGTASSNTDGSITSSVSANTTAGFSIVTYTTTSSGTDTVGHGLGVKPDVLITKSRDNAYNWDILHHSINDNGSGRFTFTSNGYLTGSNPYANTTPTASVFSFNANFYGVSDNVTYCFAEKKGYSKFGSYTGNGSTDGTFVYTGFRPAWVMIKRTDSADNWVINDNKRLGYNVDNNELFANLNNAEDTNNVIDLLSNGFKLRHSAGRHNGSGGSYIYMCFAESPFTTSTGIPTTAR